MITLLIFVFVDPNFVDPNFVDPNFVDPNFVDPNFVDPNFVDPNFVDPPNNREYTKVVEPVPYKSSKPISIPKKKKKD